MRGDEDLARLHRLVSDQPADGSGRQHRIDERRHVPAWFSFSPPNAIFAGPISLLVAAFGTALVIAEAATGSGPAWWFAGMWLFCAAWVTYWFAFRFSSEVVVTDGRLRERGFLHRPRVIPLGEVVAVGPVPWDIAGRTLRITFRSQRSVMMMGTGGAELFATSLGAACGGRIRVTPFFYARLAKRMGSTAGYDERGEL